MFTEQLKKKFRDALMEEMRCGSSQTVGTKIHEDALSAVRAVRAVRAEMLEAYLDYEYEARGTAVGIALAVYLFIDYTRDGSPDDDAMNMAWEKTELPSSLQSPIRIACERCLVDMTLWADGVLAGDPDITEKLASASYPEDHFAVRQAAL